MLEMIWEFRVTLVRLWYNMIIIKEINYDPIKYQKSFYLKSNRIS